MKKFVFLYMSSENSENAGMEAWMTWFKEIGSSVVDSGNPFGEGLELTQSGTKKLTDTTHAVTGYSIITAENIEEAEKLAKNCPAAKNMRIYEAMPM